MKKIVLNISLFLSFLLSLLILNKDLLRLPYSWDDMYYVIPASLYILTHNFSLALYGLGSGHPPFLFLIFAIFFYLFGSTSLVSHIVIFLFSGWGLFFIYRLAEKIFNKVVAIISTLFLLSSPLFLAQSSIANPAIPELTLFLASLYFLFSKRYSIFSIFCSLAVLTKEILIGLPFFALIVLYINKEKIDLKKISLVLLPSLVFFIWILTNKYLYGWFLAPYTNAILDINPLAFIPRLFLILKYVFFDDFRWILTTLALLASSLTSKTLKEHKKFKKIFVLIILLSLSFLFVSYLLVIFDALFSSQYTNFNDYLVIFTQYKLLFTLWLFLLLGFGKNIFLYWSEKKKLLMILLLFTSLIPFALTLWLPRYTLFIMPFYFLLISLVLFEKISKNKYLLFSMVLLFVLISVPTYTGDRPSAGFWLENNYEFIDYLNVRQQAADYLLENHRGKTLLAGYPEIYDLTYPWAGYTSQYKAFNLEGITYFPFPNPNQSVFDPPFDKVVVFRALNENNDYEIVYFDPTTINLENIDLVYYSPQSYALFNLEKIKKNLNLKLLKKFSQNNKSIEIYEVLK